MICVFRKYEQVLADKINRLVEKNETVRKEMQIHLESEHDLNKRFVYKCYTYWFMCQECFIILDICFAKL